MQLLIISVCSLTFILVQKNLKNIVFEITCGRYGTGRLLYIVQFCNIPNKEIIINFIQNTK
jgi:hypothetical protein